MCVLLAISLVVIFGLLTSHRAVEAALPEQTIRRRPNSANFGSRSSLDPIEPWLIFSNAAFVGRPETGMRYYNSAEDAKRQIWDHYTGVGEVLAVHG